MGLVTWAVRVHKSSGVQRPVKESIRRKGVALSNGEPYAWVAVVPSGRGRREKRDR